MPLNVWLLPVIFLSLAAAALPRGGQKAEISLEPDKPTGIAPPDL
jgi:hypothetical protein